MKTKLFVMYLCLRAVFFAAPLAAQSRLVDNAGLLDNVEKAMVEGELDAISRARDFDLVIVTEKSIGAASPMDYADDFFDYNGYGRGEDRDGCLFLVVSGNRDYWFSTSGRGIRVLSGAAFNKLEKDALAFLREDDYAGAFRAFSRDWERFLALDAKGRRYNFFHEWNLVLLAAAWLAAFGIAFAYVHVLKSRMNTALPQTQADAYMVPGSLAFTRNRDSFLYSTVSKIKREKPSSSGGGGFHTGSSGRSHGGGGGKY